MEKKYWVTTQWPSIGETEINEAHENVYIKDGTEEVVDEMEKGDIVLIYESKGGRTEIGDDNELLELVYQGRMGIVDIVKVTKTTLERLGNKPTNYMDGTSILWKSYKQTGSVYSNGFVPRKIVNEILGFKENYFYRGFGTKHSGIKRINEEQAALLQLAYLDSKNKSE